MALLDHPALHFERGCELAGFDELGEVADAAVFLLSAAGRAVTGEILMVDAGFHVTSGV